MDRVSVCEGYWMYYSDWHAGGVTRRCEAQGRSISEQLHRMRFRPSPLLSIETASDEAIEVYDALVMRYEEVVQ